MFSRIRRMNKLIYRSEVDNNIDKFCYRMTDLFDKNDPKNIILYTSWNNIDNILLHLLIKKFPIQSKYIKLVNIDTLDNDFNTTQLSSQISLSYKPAFIYRALNIKSMNDAILKGKNNRKTLFEEPYSRAIKKLNPNIIIDGSINQKSIITEESDINNNLVKFNPIYDFNKNIMIDILIQEKIPINKSYYKIYLNNISQIKSVTLFKPFPCSQKLSLIDLYTNFYIHDFYNVDNISNISDLK